MSLTRFIESCEKSDKVSVTHVICVTEDSILAKYVKYPFRMDTLKLFYSMTKSFSSMAIGIASDLGLLNIDDPIVKFFPDELPEKQDKHLSDITVRHLLMMGSGLDYDTYLELFPQPDWVRAFLAQEFPHEPGEHFRYSTHGSHMLSAIITKVSGRSLDDFLNEHLFHPMGIYEAKWEHAPEGLVAGGMGMSITPMSLVKVAQMLLNGGVHEGKRILSQDYINQLSKPHIIKQDEIGKDGFEYGGLEYGLQFHIGKRGYYRMDGSFGQMCLICPDINRAVIVFSELSDHEELIRLTYEHLLFDEELCGDICHGGLVKKENCVSADIPEVCCGLEDNCLEIKDIRLSYDGGEGTLILNRKGSNDAINFSFAQDTCGKMTFIKDLEEHYQEYVCSAEFDGSLKLKLYFIETPYIVDITLSFEKELTFDFRINESFTLSNFTVKGF